MHARLRGGAAALVLLAILLRIWDLGDPVIHPDEQFYLLVGDRILHGAVPYLDIWDRKPVGLFLFYAGLRLLPGDGVFAYQIVALVFAGATALVVRRVALAIGARDTGAVAAGAAYLLGLSLLGGRGGQAPVFYNLFVALAGWLVLRLPRPDGGSTPRAAGIGACACLLAGVAIQFKYVPAIEAALFGCVSLWAVRRSGAGWATTAGAAVLFVAIGTAPTLAAAGWYWTKGPAAFAAFRFANFTSIALRPGYPAGQLMWRILGIVAQLFPLLLCAALGWRWRPRSGPVAIRYRIAAAWFVAAVAGFVAIGAWFDHYALPLLAPLAILAAPTLGRSARALVATLALMAMLFLVERAVRRDDATGARRVAAAVAANDRGGCPYVFVGDTVTYLLADACLPGAYVFPNLLAYATERGATGIDEAAEVRRILAGRPPVIVTSTRRLSIWNPASLSAEKRALAEDYRPILSVPRASWRTVVYLRRDLPERRQAPNAAGRPSPATARVRHAGPRSPHPCPPRARPPPPRPA